MRRLRINKTQIILLVLIILGIVALFKPYTDISHTPTGLRDKNTELYSNNVKILNLEKEISSDREALEEEIKMGLDLQSLLKEEMREISSQDLEWHLPSVMIVLEEVADRNKLDLEIIHKDLKTIDPEEERIIKERQERIEEILLELENEDLEEEEKTQLEEELKDLERAEAGEEIKKDKENEENPKENEEDADNEDEVLKDDDKEEIRILDMNVNKGLGQGGEDFELKEDSEEEVDGEEEEIRSIENLDEDLIPLVEGFKTTIFPIRLTGSYQGIRNFLTKLDEINYIEPVYVNLNIKGNELVSYIYIVSIHQ